MKPIKAIWIVALLAIIVLISACSGKPSYKDGVYAAQAMEFGSSGWKDTMEITIENGKLVKINWDAIYKDESIPIRKKQYSKSGLYGMLVTGAIGEWYDQAVATEQYVLENGVESLSLDEGGYTDAIVGCTIHINEFERLLLECLAQAEK